MQFLNGFSFLTIRTISNKTTVAQSDLGPISSNSTVADGVLEKF